MADRIARSERIREAREEKLRIRAERDAARARISAPTGKAA